MQREAVRIILDEHLALGAVVYGFRQVVRKLRSGGPQIDFRLVEAMLDYVVHYPDRWHHPKEDEYLFKRLVARNPSIAKLVGELQREHVEAVRSIDAIAALLPDARRSEPAALGAFAASVERYAEFQWNHMRREEDVVIPTAERSLHDADWEEIGQAFAGNDNPLVGIGSRDESRVLYERIVRLSAALGK